MARHWAALLGLFVGVAVFLALGLPMLRTLFGPAALLATYAYIAFVAGSVTYAIVRWVSVRRTGTNRVASDRRESPDASDEDEALVKREMSQLRDDSE